MEETVGDGGESKSNELFAKMGLYTIGSFYIIIDL